VLTGHGCFKFYLKRFQKREDSICFYCQDPVEHTIFRCDRWWRQRTELEVALGTSLEPENMVPLMLLSNSKWEKIVGFLTSVLTKKEEDERQMQIEANNKIITS